MRIFLIFALYMSFIIESLAGDNIDLIKKQLLNDPQFISQLSSKVNKKAIEDTLKAFLLKNPEFMLKIQQNLVRKRVSQIETERNNVLKKALPTIYNAKEDLVLGNPKAKHTIIAFLDFNCIYCKKTYNLDEELVKKHPNTRIIIKELPILGVNSVLAHTVSRAFHEILPNKQAAFVHAMMNAPKAATKESAIEIAKTLGADSKIIESKLADKAATEKLQKYLLTNIKLAMDLKIQGTPAYIIDGHVIEGGVNLEAISTELEKQAK